MKTFPVETMRRLVNVFQANISPKKRTILQDGLLEGRCVRMDEEHISIVGLGSTVPKLLDGESVQVIYDDGMELQPFSFKKDLGQTETIVQRELLSKWLSAMNSDPVTIVIRGNALCIVGYVDAIPVACVLAARVEDQPETYAEWRD